MRTLTVCGVNIADFTIVIPAIPQPAEKTAAEFLQRVMEASCGVTLPVSDTKTAHSIVLGARDNDPDIKWDGFRTKTDDSHLYLFGNEARGTLYAAYDFAEKHIGYRYFADDCEVIPTEGEADIPANLDTVDNPTFQLRRCSRVEYGNPEFAAHMRSNCRDTTEDGIFGGNLEGIDYSCHTFDKFCPTEEYFDTHPEYFSYIIDEETGEGKRIIGGNDYQTVCGQLCLTNPDVVRIVTENVLKYLRAHSDAKTVDVSQNDNSRYCQCEKCTAAAEEDGQSGLIIRFINAVAEEVEKEFPDVLVQTFGYDYGEHPPKHTKARHNVLVRYCTFHCCFRHAVNDPNCSHNAESHAEDIVNWGKAAEHLSIWDYITNYSSYIPPFPNLFSLYENARLFADCHTIYLYESDDANAGKAGGAYGDLRAYVVGKLMWNPYISREEYEAIIIDFLKAFYGEGWREIRRYIDIEHESTADRHMKCFTKVDIAQAMSAATPELQEWFKGEYEPKPYQPANPDNALVGLCDRLDEVKALWNTAYDKADTDTRRMHIDRSRMAIDYLDLFCIKHDKKTMTEEEQAAYEAACAEFLRKKDAYNLRYNIWTIRYHAR